MKPRILIIILLVKKLLMLIILISLKKLNCVIKLLNLKNCYIVRITKYNNIFSKGYDENCSREILVIDYELKTYLWTYEIKDLNEEIIIGNFYEKELLLSKL